MAMHPVGPLPVATYWRRRAVLLAVLLLVLLVAKSCVGGGSGTTDNLGSTPSGSTPSVKAAPSATQAGAKPVTTNPTTTPAATAAPTTAPVAAACPDAVVALEPTTDLETYPVGGSPRLTVTIRNTGKAPCRRDLGSGAVELLVFSGPDRIWSSDDCSDGKAVTPTLLPAGGTQAVVLTWAGKRSLPGCAGSRAQATAGTYRVAARVGTKQADGTVFRFRS